MNTFDAECQHCNAIIQSTFDRIGHFDQCPSCNEQMELVPKINSAVETQDQNSGSKIIPIAVSALLVITVTAFFLFKKDKPTENAAVERIEKSGEDIRNVEKKKTPTPKKTVKNNVVKTPVKTNNSPVLQKKPAPAVKPNDAFLQNLEKNYKAILKLECRKENYKLAFLVKQHLVATKYVPSSRKEFQRFYIPTKYGSRETHGKFLEKVLGYNFYEIDHSSSDLPPVKLAASIPEFLIILNAVSFKNFNKERQIFNTVDIKRSVSTTDSYFTENKELIVIDNDIFHKERKVLQNKAFAAFVDSFTGKKRVFTDNPDHLNLQLTDNYVQGRKLWVEAYSKFGDRFDKKFLMAPVAKNIFICFGVLGNELFIDKKHIATRIFKKEGFKFNYQIFRTIDYEVDEFYNLNPSLSMPSKIDAWEVTFKNETLSNPLEIQSFTCTQGHKPLTMRGYDPRFFKTVPLYLKLNLPSANRHQTVAVSSNRLLGGKAATRTDICLFTKQEIDIIQEYISKHSTSGEKKKFSENVSVSKFSKLSPSPEGLTIINRAFGKTDAVYDWEIKKVLKAPSPLKLLSVIKTPKDYVCYHYSYQTKKIHMISMKSGKDYKSPLQCSLPNGYLLSRDGSQIFFKTGKAHPSVIDLKKFKVSTILADYADYLRISHETGNFEFKTPKNKEVSSYSYGKGQLKLLGKIKYPGNHSYSIIASPNYRMIHGSDNISFTLRRFHDLYIVYDNVLRRPLYSLQGYGNYDFRDCYLEGEHAVFITQYKIFRIPTKDMIKFQVRK